MPTSTTKIFDPSVRRPYQHPAAESGTSTPGFTLIELLIVVAILAIVAALIVPNIGVERRVKLHTEAERLVRAIELARVAAVTQNRQWGLRILADGYAFEQFESERKRWRRDESALFEPRSLPEGFDLSLSVESRLVQYPQARKSPSVLILSSGEMTPFSIEIFSLSLENSCTISSDGMARTGYACV